MIRILHAGDLHLSVAERDYSLAVLEELLAIATREKVEMALLAGDLFDSYADLEALRAPFRERIQALAESALVLMIAGNHERLGASGSASTLDRLDLGVAFRLREPFELIEAAGVEVLVLPWGIAASDYRGWEVPAKKARLRFALAHGTVAGLGLAGPGDEEDASAIDPDLFAHFAVDYAALGHIHTPRVTRQDATVLAYPGSARVWRRGEEGARRAVLIEADPEAGTLRPRWVEIAAAGRFRSHVQPLGLDGSCPDLSRVAEGWGPADWVELRLSGLVDDEAAVVELERVLRSRFAGGLRRLEVSRDDILVLEGIASQPIARRFLELWASRRPSDPGEVEVWLAAREAGLRRLKSLMEARR